MNSVNVSHTRKRADRRMVYVLFLFTLVVTCIVKVALFSTLLFTSFILLDIFLFFLSLVVFQLSWDTITSAQSPQEAVLSNEQRLPATLQELLRLAPSEFEAFIGLVIEAMGYTHVQQIGGSGDHGADLLARNYFNLRIIVQCKLYAPDNQVGSPDLQRFLGSIVHYRAIEGWFVTTSSFTQPALDFAEMNNERIRLLNGEALVAFLQQRQREIYFVWQQRNKMAGQ